MLGLGSLLAEDVNLLERSVLTEEELNGVLAEAAELEPESPEAQKVTARINRGAKAGRVVATRDLRDRSQYSVRAHQLPASIREALAKGMVKPVNMAFYKILDISGLGKQFEIMQNADTKLSGVTNVNNRKLEENNFFLLTGVALQMGTFTAAPHDASFNTPTAAVLNGEFSLKNGDKVLIHPSSCRVFDTKGTMIAGMWKLDNPKFIAPQTEIIPEIKLPNGVPTKTALKLVLLGVGLSKA